MPKLSATFTLSAANNCLLRGLKSSRKFERQIQHGINCVGKFFAYDLWTQLRSMFCHESMFVFQPHRYKIIFVAFYVLVKLLILLFVDLASKELENGSTDFDVLIVRFDWVQYTCDGHPGKSGSGS